MIEKREIEIGEIDVNTSKIRVTDPSYDPSEVPSACYTVVDMVKRGIWKCVATMADIPEWGERVLELWIHHKDKRELEGENMVGYSAVDSGQCGFFFNDDFERLYKNKEKSDKWYKMVCKENKDAGVIVDEGVVTSSGLGDGLYEVFTEYDEHGEVDSIHLIFLNVDEEW